MSRERELLKKILATGWLDHKLSCEVEELLTQSEQEPTTRHALDSYWNQEAYQRGYAEAKLKLKREPLTSKLISLGNNCHESFIKGVRFAEKMHGIGGGE